MDHLFTGKVWVFGDNINTDLMYPHICYSLPEDQRPLYTMWANRPGWASQVSRGDILVAGKNFGVGSSRPAAANLKALGLGCVIAETVNGLFLRNSVNFGFPSVACKGVTEYCKEGDTITIDFNCGTVIKKDNKPLIFQKLPPFLMEIIDAGGIIEVLKKKGFLEDTPL